MNLPGNVLSLLPGAEELPVRSIRRGHPPHDAEVLRLLRRLAEAESAAAVAAVDHLSENLSSGKCRSLEAGVQLLSPTDRATLNACWGRRVQEFLSLAHERDPRVFHSGVFAMARRFEDDEGYGQAQLIYFELNEGSSLPAVAPEIRARARQRLDAIQGTGALGPRFAFQFSQITERATDPAMIAGFGFGNLVASTFRFGLAARLFASSAESFLTRGFGASLMASSLALAVEVPAVWAGTHGVNILLGRESGINTAHAWDEMASLGILLGSVRAGGALTHGLFRRVHGVDPLTGQVRRLETFSRISEPLVRQFGMFSGIYLSRLVESRLGMRPAGDTLSLLAESLVELMHFNAGGYVSERVLGPGYARLLGELQIRTRQLEAPRPWRFPDFPDGSGLLQPANVPADWAVPGRYIENDPVEAVEKSDHILMSRGKPRDTDRPKRPASLASLLRQISLFNDERSIRLGLRALYIGITGPLREEILATLERIEGGVEPPGLLTRNLLTDPRLEQTRFLSSDLHRRLSDQIHNLKTGGRNRDTGTFFFNLSHGMPESLPEGLPEGPPSMREGPTPKKLTAEALLPLLEMRMQELDKLLTNPDPLPFTTREALAEGIEVARNYRRVVEGMVKQKDRDFLTQLRNRFELDRITPRLEHRLLKFMEYTEGPKLEDCVLMLDIDNFKRINDIYGHAGGDDVLREVAQVLRDPETIRLRDIIVRYGGEEFLIFLFKAGREGAAIAAERIRKTIEEHSIEVENEEGKIDMIRATVSIGIAEMRALAPKVNGGSPVIEGSLEHAQKRADMALYAAKAVGRNRVIFNGDPNFDWTTGILNRSGLENMVPSLETRLSADPVDPMNPSSRPWVLKLDVDHLDVINFAYDPFVGDRVLTTVAQTLREASSRGKYLAARYLENEFLVILNNSDPNEVLQIAKRIREDVRQREIAVPGRAPIHVTLSVGAAEMRPLIPPEGEGPPGVAGSFGNALERAGRALDAAKREKQHRILLSGE